ncbi:hypothetical protein Trydic_g9471 [Trypoxylus dichotomus]
MKIPTIHPQLFLLILVLGTSTNSAPTKSESRRAKSLSYFDYIQPDDDGDFHNYIDESEDYQSPEDYDLNQISRMIPTKKRATNLRKPSFNSPIYYIRLPPQPYMFVPGLGYISRPVETGPGALLNLPVNFISNGKPGMIYQWSGSFNSIRTPIKPAIPAPKPEVVKPTPIPKPDDSKIHRLPGKYVFNGKPNDIYVLGDSYNSIYGDALHNFYP